MRPPSFSWTRWKCKVCSSTAVCMRTGTLTSPNEIAPVHTARGMPAFSPLDLQAKRTAGAPAACKSPDRVVLGSGPDRVDVGRVAGQAGNREERERVVPDRGEPLVVA